MFYAGTENSRYRRRRDSCSSRSSSARSSPTWQWLLSKYSILLTVNVYNNILWTCITNILNYFCQDAKFENLKKLSTILNWYSNFLFFYIFFFCNIKELLQNLLYVSKFTITLFAFCQNLWRKTCNCIKLKSSRPKLWIYRSIIRWLEYFSFELY